MILFDGFSVAPLIREDTIKMRGTSLLYLFLFFSQKKKKINRRTTKHLKNPTNQISQILPRNEKTPLGKKNIETFEKMGQDLAYLA